MLVFRMGEAQLYEFSPPQKSAGSDENGVWITMLCEPMNKGAEHSPIRLNDSTPGSASLAPNPAPISSAASATSARETLG